MKVRKKLMAYFLCLTMAASVLPMPTVRAEGEGTTRGSEDTEKATCNHEYGYFKWVWEANGEGGYSAKAQFTCSKCAEGTEGHMEEVEAKVTKSTTDATCTEAGEEIYTAEAEFQGKKYTGEKTVSILPKGHKYGEPEWVWEEDGKGGYSAKAKFTCSKCAEGTDGHMKEVEAEVTKSTKDATCTEAGNETYTAKAEFKKKLYTKNKEVSISATGHKWNDKPTVDIKPKKNKEGKQSIHCGKCGATKNVSVIPAKNITFNLAKAQKVISDASDCKFTLDKKYKKYFVISKKGKISVKKKHFVKVCQSVKSLKIKVAIDKKTYTVTTKIQIPKPKVAISKESIRVGNVSGYRYRFKYDIKGATKIQVRIKKMQSLNHEFDTYVSKPKSDGMSYINLSDATIKKLGNKAEFEITAYYGKNVSEKFVQRINKVK